MKPVSLKIIAFLIVVFIFTFGKPFEVLAEETESFAKKGWYIGLIAPYNTIGGDFDGNTVLTSANDIILIPKIDSALGWGISIGKRYSNDSSLEASLLMSSHDVTFAGATGKVEYMLVNFDWKRYFSVERPTQPYFLLGFAISQLVVKDGSATISASPTVGDATLSGSGLNIGGGVAYFVKSNISINGEAIYRWITYNMAKGVVTEGALEKSLSGSGINFSISMTYGF